MAGIGPGTNNATVPPEIDGSPDGSPVLYNVPLAAQITSSAAVTLIIAPATGTYRIGVCANQTVLGVGSPGTTTYTPTVIFTAPQVTTTSSVAMAAFATTGTTNGALGYIAAASGISQLLFRAAINTAIQVSVGIAGGGGTTNPTVQITPVLESMGQ